MEIIKNKDSKARILSEIKRAFEDKSLTKEKLKKVKRLAMSKNIKLGDLRKKFCKSCFSLFSPNNSEIRINTKMVKIQCNECGYITRYKIYKQSNNKKQ